VITTAVFEITPECDQIRDCTVLVRCADGGAAARGLWMARRRLWYATAEGEEITEDDIQSGDGSDRFAPSHISPVWRSELGPVFYLDVGPCAPAEMAAVMRRIIVEEPRRAGITDADVTGFPQDWAWDWDAPKQEWTVDGHSMDDDLLI